MANEFCANDDDDDIDKGRQEEQQDKEENDWSLNFYSSLDEYSGNNDDDDDDDDDEQFSMEEIIIDVAAGTEKEVALRDWMAISEKYLQIRRCSAILGFTQGKTDAGACTVWTREGTNGWKY